MSRLSDALDRVSEAADDGALPEVPVLAFVVPGEPVAKGRPKVSTAGGIARAYTPKKTSRYEDRVLFCAREAVARAEFAALAGPIRVEVRAIFKRPGRLFRKKDHAGQVRHTKRPDLDNVVKGVLDGMNDAGIWGDDAQVAEVRASKFYAEIQGDRRDKVSGPPRVLVSIFRLDEENAP